MPHVSRHTIKNEVKHKLEERLSSLLSESGGKRYHALKELLTPTEHIMLAKRLSMVFLISRGVPTHTISEVLRVSPSTVARFEVAFDQGAYQHVNNWLNVKSRGEKLFEAVVSMLAIPFEAQHKSPSRMMREREAR